MTVPRIIAVIVSTALIALIGGFLLGRKSAPTSSQRTGHERAATYLKPGPWGQLESVPITIAAPVELLSVQKEENAPVYWYLKNVTQDEFGKFLAGLDLPVSQRVQLLTALAVTPVKDGLQLAPACEFLFNLKPPARLELYKLLARFSENDRVREVILATDLDEWVRVGLLSSATASLIKQMSCPFGKYLFCYCAPCLLEAIPTYEEKVRLQKSLSRQRTMLLRLRITPDTDINSLAAYWGKAFWTTDVKALLESLAQVPGGASLDLIELLPPWPTSLLYTYPMPQNPKTGPVARRDCQWTSFNFFRDPPDPGFSDKAYIEEKLNLNYFPIQSDPRYGDLVMFFTPDGRGIHTAVFIADNVVYSKNGDNDLHPWIFATIPELLDVFSFNVAPGQQLSLQFYRNKYY